MAKSPKSVQDQKEVPYGQRLITDGLWAMLSESEKIPPLTSTAIKKISAGDEKETPITVIIDQIKSINADILAMGGDESLNPSQRIQYLIFKDTLLHTIRQRLFRQILERPGRRLFKSFGGTKVTITGDDVLVTPATSSLSKADPPEENPYGFEFKEDLQYHEPVPSKRDELFAEIKRIYGADDRLALSLASEIDSKVRPHFTSASAPEISLPADGIIPKYRDYLASNPDAPRDPGQYYIDNWKRYEVAGLTLADLRRHDMPLVNAIYYQKGQEAVSFLPPTKKSVTKKLAEAGDAEAIARQVNAAKRKAQRKGHAEPN